MIVEPLLIPRNELFDLRCSFGFRIARCSGPPRTSTVRNDDDTSSGLQNCSAFSGTDLDGGARLGRVKLFQTVHSVSRLVSLSKNPGNLLFARRTSRVLFRMASRCRVEAGAGRQNLPPRDLPASCIGFQISQDTFESSRVRIMLFPVPKVPDVPLSANCCCHA
jgi:hypothetical protein